MTRLLFACLVLTAVLAGAAPARAQEKVDVRTGDHSDYQRLVIDWPAAADYTLTREGNVVTVRFARPGSADLAGAKTLANISALAVLSKDKQNLALRFRVPENSTLRDLRAGRKIIIDVYDPPGGRTAQTPPAPAPKPVSKPKEQPSPAADAAPESDAPKQEDKEENEQEPQDKPDEQAVQPAEKETPKPEEPLANSGEQNAPPPTEEAPQAAPAEAPEAVEENPKPTEPAPQAQPAAADKPAVKAGIDPHVMTVTSTKKIGLALFERGDWLWLVTDDPDMSVPPALAGPQVEQLGLLQRFKITDGTAYRMKKPVNTGITAEGGGLRWRIVFSPNPKEVENIEPERLSPVAASEQTRAPRQGAALRWPLQSPRKILTLIDPDIGDTIKIVTLSASTASVRKSYGFVELDVLPAYIGLAFVPLADDVQVSLQEDGVRIGRGEKDLSLSMNVPSGTHERRLSIAADQDLPMANINNIFHPARWQMGGVRALGNNQSVLMGDLSGKEKDGKVEDLITLAKLTMANGYGSEALGYLGTAEQIMPDITENPEFIALRGASYLLAGQADLAIADIVNPALNAYQDIPYWRMATFAALEDWQQALSVMPPDARGLRDYPERMRTPLSLTLAEVALRDGRMLQAERILAGLEPAAAGQMMDPPDNREWTYLMGEAARQLKQYEKAKEYWGQLAEGRDDYYRVKAGLALTRLLLERNEIDAAQAVNRLESLRYAWRGDELEALVNYRLGQVYVQNKDYLKGLHVLRNAAALAPDSALSREVTDYMSQSFRTLFDSGDLQTISPLDSIGVYEEFKELTPPGTEGDRIVEQLAERMVEADLLNRAEALLTHQLAHRLSGIEAARVSLRLAAIRLLNNKPDEALKSLAQAETLYKEGEGGAVPPEKMREITLLRANALSRSDQADEAIELLEKLPADKTIARLRADIAWKSQRWNEAADGLQSLIDVEQIRPESPLNEGQADLILNRAIALNLAGDRVGLSALRDRYNAQMAQTPKAELFDVVTLPRRFGLIRSRDTIAESINNVDLFKDFLESYRKVDVPPSAAEPVATPAPQTEAAPEPGEAATDAPDQG